MRRGGKDTVHSVYLTGGTLKGGGEAASDRRYLDQYDNPDRVAR